MKKSQKVNISLNKGGPDGPLGMNIAIERSVIIARFTQRLPDFERCCVAGA